MTTYGPGSSVGILADYGLDGPGSNPGRDEIFRPSRPARHEYQEYFLRSKGGRCVGLTTLPPSCADCFDIWEPQTPGTLRACPGL